MMAHIARGTVFVVRQRFHDHGNAAGAIAFICHGNEVFRTGAGRLLQHTVDVFVRDVIGFCLGNDIAQAVVAVGVCTAVTDGNSNFLADSGENFCLCGISAFFFAFDIVPFGMTRHIVPPESVFAV